MHVQVLSARESVVDAWVLKNNAYAFTHLHSFFGDVETVDPGRSACGFKNCAQHVYGGCFACAVGPQQAKDFSRVHRYVKFVYGGKPVE